MGLIFKTTSTFSRLSEIYNPPISTFGGKFQQYISVDKPKQIGGISK